MPIETVHLVELRSPRGEDRARVEEVRYRSGDLPDDLAVVLARWG